MRTIKLIILALLGVVLVTIGVGNMAPVELHLIPAKVANGAFTLPNVPLAAVIMVAVLVGILIGQFLEFLRERKYRRVATVKGREIDVLRREVSRLKTKAGEKDELPILRTQ